MLLRRLVFDGFWSHEPLRGGDWFSINGEEGNFLGENADLVRELNQMNLLVIDLAGTRMLVCRKR